MSGIFRKNDLLNNRYLPAPEELKSFLFREIIEPWFPVCIDNEYGGFLCDFDRGWRPNGSHHKLLEFQARQTWTAAEASLAYPDREYLSEIALHGFRFLMDVMWDKSAGGWFHRTDRKGKPLEKATKHMHGVAYAIPACIAVYAATGEREALRAAFTGFEWLDNHAYDHEYGGYFGFLNRDGKPIKEVRQNPLNGRYDTIDTPIGCKDANVHTDLLETLVYLYCISPKKIYKERLYELISIVTKRLGTKKGEIHSICRFDWSLDMSDETVPEGFGYNMQGAHRLLSASSILPGRSDLVNDAKRFIDHALKYGWDTQYGGMFAGLFTDAKKTINKEKLFWIQMETLWALLAISKQIPDNSAYHPYLFDIWKYIRVYLTDKYHHGIYKSGTDTFQLLNKWYVKTPKIVTKKYADKGNIWKDASHSGRALLRCIHALENGYDEDWIIFPLRNLLENQDTSDVQ